MRVILGIAKSPDSECEAIFPVPRLRYSQNYPRKLLKQGFQTINVREHLYFNVNLSMTFVCNAQLYLNALF